jgi:hypothetical protein
VSALFCLVCHNFAGRKLQQTLRRCVALALCACCVHVRAMAKWGEGDSRWIVQERDDGANVNGWHWEEKQRMHWMRERIPKLLQDLSADDPTAAGKVRVKEVTSVDGDVRIFPRFASDLERICSSAAPACNRDVHHHTRRWCHGVVVHSLVQPTSTWPGLRMLYINHFQCIRVMKHDCHRWPVLGHCGFWHMWTRANRGILSRTRTTPTHQAYQERILWRCSHRV